MNTEERDGGNGWPEGHFDGANLRFFGSRDGVFAIDVHCYAAAAGRALDIEAIEDLAFNWGYGMLRGDPDGVANAAPSANRCSANKDNLPRIPDLDFCCVVGDDAVCVC